MKPETAPKAVKAEIEEASTVEIEWDGKTWTIPASPDHWSALALQALEQGKPMTFLENVLGRQQWGKFTRGKRSSAGDASELTSLVYGAYGEDEPGE